MLCTHNACISAGEGLCGSLVEKKVYTPLSTVSMAAVGVGVDLREKSVWRIQ